MTDTDHELEAAIVAELEWTPSVTADEISVIIDKGAVTLSGDVATYPQKEQAVRAALRVRGVRAVADEIVVRPTAIVRADTDIARLAAHALERTVVVPSGMIKATVHDKVITLVGAVPWHYQRNAASKAVAAIPGVAGLRDLVRIEAQVEVSPEKAKSAITAALIRNAHVDAKRIHVDVKGTQVTLTGTASSPAECRQAVHAAWSTPGVTGVDDQLTIEN